MKTVKFRSVAQLFSKPGSWCRGTLARDAEGKRVTVRSAKAEAFCLLGALTRVYGRGPKYKKAVDILAEYLLKKYGTPTIIDFNDDVAKNIKQIRSVIRHSGV